MYDDLMKYKGHQHHEPPLGVQIHRQDWQMFHGPGELPCTCSVNGIFACADRFFKPGVELSPNAFACDIEVRDAKRAKLIEETYMYMTA